MDEQQTQTLLATRQQVLGSLNLGFDYDQAAGQTRLLTNAQRPPLKVIRAFPLPSGGVLVHLHNLSGGVLGGDQLSLTVELSSQAYAQLTTTSATRIYRARPGIPAACQTTIVRVQDSGLLEYLPDPIIPFAGSRYQQHTQIDLATDAGLFWWETLAPGRTAHGEQFAYSELGNSLIINALNTPIAIERYQLSPAQQELSSPLRLGPYTHLCSFYICRVGLPPQIWLALEQRLNKLATEISQPGTIIWAVSTLTAHGLVVRALSHNGRAIPPGLLAFWRTARRELYQQEARLPRKVY